MAPRDGEETQEINDIPVIEERIRNENGPVEPNETEIRVHVETEITETTVIRHIETDNGTQTNKQTCYSSNPSGCKRSWSEKKAK